MPRFRGRKLSKYKKIDTRKGKEPELNSFTAHGILNKFCH